MTPRSRRFQSTASCLQWIKTAVSAPMLTSRFYHGKGFSLDDVLFVLDLSDEPLVVMQKSKLPEKDLRQLHGDFSGLRQTFDNLRPNRTFHVLAHFCSPNHVLCCYHRTHHRLDHLDKTNNCLHSDIYPVDPLGTLWRDRFEAWNLLNSLLASRFTGSPRAISIDRLNATGKIERSHHSHWSTTFKAAVVDGRILVSVTGHHWPTRFIHMEAGKPVHRNCHFCLDHIHSGPLACPHVLLLPPNFQQVRKLEVGSGREEGYVMEDPEQRLESSRTELEFDVVRKCPHCPSEYMYTAHKKGGLESVQITRWVDFGSCQTPWDRAWLDLTRWASKTGTQFYEYGALRVPEEEAVAIWSQPALSAKNLSIRQVFEHATTAQCKGAASEDEDSSDTSWTSDSKPSLYKRITDGWQGWVKQLMQPPSGARSRSLDGD